MSQGQRGGNENKKSLRAKECRRVSKSFEKLYQLFSSFLRGASRPKSPRFAAASGFTINDRQSAACQHVISLLFLHSTGDQKILAKARPGRPLEPRDR